ncbi:MAG: ferrous iron transport protein A [Campylobacteraceae bacterium]|nr:ferrous iron transport protein A [Campylobacteraceae bacterium]
MSLFDGKKGKKYKIVNINAEGKVFYKLLDMGFVNGVTTEVVRRAPLNDPIELKIHNYLITLRGSEARLIEVEEV